MNESRFEEFFGEGGTCDPSVAPEVGVDAPGDGRSDRACSGCSWWVAVVGDESSEAEVGVEIVGAGAAELVGEMV